MINDEIEITVLQIRGNRVRLGCEAPKEVPVHRKEVWEQRQELATAKPPSPDKPVVAVGIPEPNRKEATQ